MSKDRPVAIYPFWLGYPTYVFNCPGMGAQVRDHCRAHCRVQGADTTNRFGLVDYDGGGFTLHPCPVARQGFLGRLDKGCALAGAKFNGNWVDYMPDDRRIKVTLELRTPSIRLRVSADEILDGAPRFDSGANGQARDYIIHF